MRKSCLARECTGEWQVAAICVDASRHCQIYSANRAIQKTSGCRWLVREARERVIVHLHICWAHHALIRTIHLWHS